MAMLRRVGLAGFAIVLGLAGAVACSGGGAHPNLSSVASSGTAPVASPSRSAASPSARPYPADVPLTGHNVKPGEKPPVYPAEAQVKSQAAANAFAEFFMRTLDWMYATTNASYPRHYFGPTCGLCSGIATGITKTAAEGHWYLGGRLTIRSVTSAPIAQVTAPADFCTSVTTDITSESVVDNHGSVYSGAGAQPDLKWKLCTKWQDTHWTLTYFAGLA